MPLIKFVACALLMGLGASAARCQMSLLSVGTQTGGVSVAPRPGGVTRIVDARRAQLRRWLELNGITRRAVWTAIRGNEARMEQDWDYDTLVVHHSGDGGRTDPEEILRLHITPSPLRPQVYDDIAYHFAIRPDGEILEARSLIFKGANCSEQNTKKIGVILLGDFQPQWWDASSGEPTHAQLAELQRLTVALKELFPTLRRMRGHRDFASRAPRSGFRMGGDHDCPGDNLYRRLPELRRLTELE